MSSSDNTLMPAGVKVNSTSSLTAHTLSRKKMKKACKVTQKINLTEGSVDVMVQHTNDDSVVSKRSAVAHGYMRDPFLRHFVKKPSRRSPLINRGYYLRMAVMTDLVVHLVKTMLRAPERGSECSTARLPVQVLSLGAGYDTLAMRLLLDSATDLLNSPMDPSQIPASPSPSTTSFAQEGVLFVDVDFPEVLRSKAALMAAAPPNSFPDDWQIRPKDTACPVTSPQYAAVGVDLRTAPAELLPRLQQYAPAGFSVSHPTVIYAECVMQYMPTEDAATLVALLASIFPNAVFLAYDQVSPLDSFGRVMQQSLKQKNSPLLGIQACGDATHMTRRALRSGMRRAWWANFYRVSQHVLTGAEKTRVERLEAFDELEEWSEMCEHYGITMASTAAAWPTVVDEGCARHPAFVEYKAEGVSLQEPAGDWAPAHSTSHAVAGTLHNWPSARYGFEGWGNGGVAVELLPSGDRLLVSFGGFAVSKQHSRVNTVYVHSLQEGELCVVVAAAEKEMQLGNGRHGPEALTNSVCGNGAAVATCAPPDLVFHSFTRIGHGQYLVWGGRTNPAAQNSNAYLLTLDLPRTVSHGGIVRARWSLLLVDASTSCVPAGRYRHSMVCLRTLEDREEKGTAILLLLGGKLAAPPLRSIDGFLVTVSLMKNSISYEALALEGSEAGVVPPSMHSAAAVALSDDVVLLSGGHLSKEDACNEDLWRLCLSSRTWTRTPVRLPSGRYSHTITPVTVDSKAGYLVLGGSTWADKSLVPPAVFIDAAAVTAGSSENTPEGAVVQVHLPDGAPWLSRHSCVALGAGVVGVIGGGYTCFSFGTFTAKPQLLYLGGEVDESAWRGTCTAAAGKSALTGDTTDDQTVYSYPHLLTKPWRAVREVKVYTPESFLAAARAASEPVVFRRAHLGACVQQWASPAYLIAAEGSATVSVHVAERSPLLDFVRKNFAFRHVTFAELVQHVKETTDLYRATRDTPVETWYYRSIAAHMKSERSNLWTDFATLGKDFVLPPGAKEFIEPRLHQACLRMNAPPLQLWTHFDTLDNVLCQIVGIKRVVLFPPSAYNDLYISGSSSAVINLDAPDLVRYPRFIDACKSALEVILRPGDMLYLPAMWFHQITTLDEEEKMDINSPNAAQQPYNISVNVFYRHFDDASVYDEKDLYGNKNILAVTRMREDLQAAVRTIMCHALLDGVDGAAGHMVPSEYAEFALRQFLQDVEAMANTMAETRCAGAARVTE